MEGPCFKEKQADKRLARSSAGRVSACVAHAKSMVPSQTLQNPVVVVCGCNLSTQEVETQDQTFKVILDYPIRGQPELPEIISEEKDQTESVAQC